MEGCRKRVQSLLREAASKLILSFVKCIMHLDVQIVFNHSSVAKAGTIVPVFFLSERLLPAEGETLNVPKCFPVNRFCQFCTVFNLCMVAKMLALCRLFVIINYE